MQWLSLSLYPANHFREIVLSNVRMFHALYQLLIINNASTNRKNKCKVLREVKNKLYTGQILQNPLGRFKPFKVCKCLDFPNNSTVHSRKASFSIEEDGRKIFPALSQSALSISSFGSEVLHNFTTVYKMPPVTSPKRNNHKVPSLLIWIYDAIVFHQS